jgi:hypothetical protein
MPSTPQLLTCAAAHAQPGAAVVEALGSDADRGLSGAEAHRRLQSHGDNSITSRGGKPAWAMNTFFSTSPLNLQQLLICALPMLAMLPVAWLGERLDPTDGRLRP